MTQFFYDHQLSAVSSTKTIVELRREHSWKSHEQIQMKCLKLFGAFWRNVFFLNQMEKILQFSQKIVCWNMARGWYWSLNCDDSRMRCIRSFVLHSGNVEIEWSVPDNFYLSLNILEFFRLKCHEQPMFIDLLRFIKKNEEQRSVWYQNLYGWTENFLIKFKSTTKCDGVRLQTSRFIHIRLISCRGTCGPSLAISRIASGKRRMAG